MTDVVLFHHALGLTDGLRAFADTFRSSGHTVHLADLFDGATFDDVASGVAHADEIGFGTIIERGVTFGEAQPAEAVYVGFSLGVLPAQKLAQTRAGARGAVLIGSCVPPSDFGGDWPADVPVQVHGMDADEFFVGDGDIEAARALVAAVDDGELFVYPGDGHLIADSSAPDYDADAAALLTERVLAFLARVS